MRSAALLFICLIQNDLLDSAISISDRTFTMAGSMKKARGGGTGGGEGGGGEEGYVQHLTYMPSTLIPNRPPHQRVDGREGRVTPDAVLKHAALGGWIFNTRVQTILPALGIGADLLDVENMTWLDGTWINTGAAYRAAVR